MARPHNQGISYFSFDCNFYSDRKIRRILKSCGPAAGTALTCLLCNIYQEDGYYILWDEDLPFDIADMVGMSEGPVREVIQMALKVGFFDQEKYDKHKILTSSGIQKRYVEGTKQRTTTEINPDYWIDRDRLPKGVDNSIFGVPEKEPEKLPPRVSNLENGRSIYENAKPKNENPEIIPRSTQSKVKYSKVKQSKVKESNQADAETDSKSIERFIQGFEKRFSASFSRDNVAALKNSVIAHRDAIECDYLNLEIFLRTMLMRMDDIRKSKEIKSPINFFFAGVFGARYLWTLTAQEEEVGSGYHKPMIRAAEAGKSPIAGLKTMV